MQIKLVQSHEDLLRCFPVIHELRPHLTVERFVEMYEQMQKESYQIAFVEEPNQEIWSAVGFRCMNLFYAGKIIYIDDLSTLPQARGKGRASQLLDFVKQFAIGLGCDAIHLDSGHQRHDAHRLYLQKKFKIASHHFILELPKNT